METYQRSHDEEQAESPVHSLECILDVNARALSLCSDHRDIFGTNNTEGSSPESSKEAFEAAQVSGGNMLCERPWDLPIPETVCVSLRITPNHGDKGEGKQHENQYDLPSRQPELSLTISLDSQDIDYSIKRNGDADDCGCRNVVAPELEDFDQSSDFERDEETLVEKEIPASHEATERPVCQQVSRTAVFGANRTTHKASSTHSPARRMNPPETGIITVQHVSVASKIH